MKIHLIRLCYKIINPIRKFYWFIFQPYTRGVKCIVEYKGKVLLVKISYAHKKWTIPGGGVSKKESFEDAARREIKEEVGIKLTNLNKIGEYVNTKEYKIDTVEVFSSHVNDLMYNIDRQEIDQARWFDIDGSDLPSNRMLRVDLLLEMYRSQK